MTATKTIDLLAIAAERALRITVWNFLRERGAKQDYCFPIIEGAVTNYRAALRVMEASNGKGDNQ